jgi:hypothetical protein
VRIRGRLMEGMTYMSPTSVIMFNDDPVLQEQLEYRIVGPAYTLITLSSAALSSTIIEQAHPAVIVINVSSHHSSEQEQSFLALLSLLHTDSLIAQIPVVVCSDRRAVLQSVIQDLQPRPGAVSCSEPEVDELLAKLQFTQD